MAIGVAAGGALIASAAGATPVHASGTQRYASPFGTDTGNCSVAAAPCATVTYTVSQSASGDTINLAPGAYTEQVAISQNVTIVGAGQDDTTIQPPAALTADTQGQTYIVAITGSSTVVTMSKLTVAGPGPSGGGNNCGANSGSLDKGITVFDGATLNLSNAAVRNVYNLPVGGCQRGDAISIGSPCYTCGAGVGHATLNGVKISVYQKNGVAVRGLGSTLKMIHSRVINNPSSVIASNGIEVLNSAVGVVTTTTVIGNECNLTGVCGPNPFTDTTASGILLSQSGAGTSLSGNTVQGNDIGVYTDDGVQVTHNLLSGNRSAGLFVDVDAANGTFSFNTANSTASVVGAYGIITQSGQGNKFRSNIATGNSQFDLDAANISGVDSNVTSSNTCTTASPSHAYWHC